MKRRALLSTAIGLLAAAPGVHAQASRAPGKIGYLHPRTVAPDHSTLQILRPAWQRQGFVEGESILLRQELYFPRAILMADKILRGANVAQMPIEGPDRFELVINMVSARAIGLKIPAVLLQRADEVIQ